MQHQAATKNVDQRIWLAIMTVFFFMLAGTATGQTAVTMTDKEIEIAVEDELIQDQAVSSFLVDISCTEGIVTLTGSVNNLLAKDRALAIAETVKGVRSVINRIEVNPVIEKSDEDIQVDVVQSLLNDPVTELFEIDVTVNDKVVALKGKADSHIERQHAGRVAKSVGGVKEVKNRIILDYKTPRSDEDLANDIEQALRWDTLVDDALILVSVNNGKVDLKGTVGSAAEKRRAVNHAWLPGIKEVEPQMLKVSRWARDKDLRHEKYVPRSDEQIKDAVDKAILYDPRVLSTKVDTQVNNKLVTLTGRVNYLSAKKAAAQDAKNTVGVIRVKNQIKVTPVPVAENGTELEQKILNKFRRDTYVDNLDISVTALSGVVSLYGTVDTYYEKTRAEDLVSEVKGVYAVNNNINVNRDWEPFVYKPYVDESYVPDYEWYAYQPRVTATKNDREIEDNIESELFWSPFVDSDSVNVIVDDGKATLIGQVDSWSEYDAATQNALEGGAVAVDNELTISSITR